MQKIIAKQALTQNGWESDIEIGVKSGRIVQIRPAPDGANASVGLALPAPLNLHSHAFQRAMSGLTEVRGPDPKDSFWTWRRLMYKFLDQLAPDQIEAIAAQVFLEMLGQDMQAWPSSITCTTTQAACLTPIWPSCLKGSSLRQRKRGSG